MAAKRIYLTGFMGCGKSTVGRMLAPALKWRFIDLDKYIEDKEGRTIPEIFAAEGESFFRQLENEALQDIVSMEDVVVATGGGAPCFLNNMQLMNESGLTVYLKVAPEELFLRLGPGKTERPLLAGKSDEELIAFIREKLGEREPWYLQAKETADAGLWGMDHYLRIVEKYL